MFKNRIRLPLYLKNAQFPTEATRFRRSDGSTQTLAVTIRKTYAIATDYMSDEMHQRTVVALNHDEVSIEGDRYFGGVALDGEYEITRPDFLDYPLGQAAAVIQVTPFDMTNSNCQTCDEASQLSLVDDDAGEIEEGVPAIIDVFDNDTICCYPPVAEITWFDNTYLASATIDPDTGEVTLTTLDPVQSVGNIKLATYRVACPDGSYDEADIYGSIAGSEESCEQPTDIQIAFSDPPAPFNLTATWTPPAVPPTLYEYILTLNGVTVCSGNNPSPEIFGSCTNLLASTEYVLSVRSVCSEGVYSPYTNLTFTTPAGEVETCGNFEVSCDDGTTNRDTYNYSYMDCNGNIQNRTIVNLSTREVCMLMDSSNDPIYFETTGPVDYTYIEPC